MTFRVSNHNKRYAKASLIASTAFVSAFMAATPAAYANGCSPSLIGTAGDDTITCTGPQTPGVPGIVRAGAGDDTIIVTDANSAGVDWDVNGDEGSDTLTVTDSTINDIRSDASFLSGELASDGNDSITFTNSTLVEQLYLAGGDDTFVAIDSTINDVYVGSGNDVVTLNNTRLDTFVSSLGGNETLTLTNGALINSDVDVADGTDAVSLENSTINGSLIVGGDTATDGDDSVSLTNGSVVNGTIALGVGNNTLLVDNSTVSGAVTFGAGNDSVTIRNGGSVGGDLITGGGNDTVLVENSTFENGIQIITGDGNDSITVSNSDNTDNAVDTTAGSGDDIIVIRNSVVNDVRGDNVNSGAEDGNDTITITNSTVEGQIDGFGGADVITMTGGSILNAQGSRGTFLIAGDGDDEVRLTDVTVRAGDLTTGDGADLLVLSNTTIGDRMGGVFGGIQTGDDNDMVTVTGGSDVHGGLFSGAGDDIVTISGSTVGGSVGTVGVSTGDGDDLVNLNGTVSGFVDLGADNDMITLTSASIIDTTASYDLFGNSGEDTITVEGGTFNNGISGGADNDLITMNAGTVGRIDPGAGDDVVNIYGGTVLGGNFNATNFNGLTGDDTFLIDPTQSAAALDLTAIQTFDGGSGDNNATFRNVETSNQLVDNVNFDQWVNLIFENSAINIDDSTSITNLNLVNTDMTQVDGDLNLSNGATILSSDASSTINMQDGVVDDRIQAQFNPSGGSLLSVDVDTFEEGLNLADSDYIVGGTHTPEAGAIVNVSVLDVGATSQRGSRRIVDSNAADVAAPELGDLANPSSTYVLQNDPSFGARQFWLQDDANGGVYLVWTTPVSPVTMAAVLGGQATSSDFVRPDGTVIQAFNPDGTLNLKNPNLRVDPNAKGAGLDTLAAGQTASFLAGTINGAGRGVDCQADRKNWNLWGSLGYETGEYGQSEMDIGTAAVGAEKDVSSALKAECGRYKAGIFAFKAHTEIDHPLTGSDNEPNSYGVGLYLKGSTENNFYGSVMGYIGETDYNGVNNVLESRFRYDTSDWGARLDVGKLIPFKDGSVEADIRGYVGLTKSDTGLFADSNGFEISSIENDGFNYGASVGLNKYYENNQRAFGRLGVDFNDIDSKLVAYTIPVDSAPSYTLGTVEAGYENTTGNGRGTFRVSGLARFGSESESYGGRVTGIVRF